MNMEIVKVEAPKELAAEQINAVKEAFKENFDAMGELEPRYKALTDIKLVEPTKEQCKEARAVRLALVKTRTGTAGTHKGLKADALVFGRYLDGMKKAQLIACEKRESDLLEIEKHFENIEKERIVKLQTYREGLLHKLEIETMPAALGTMSEDVWDNYYDGVYQDFKRRKAAERQAEEDRIAKEKAAAEERERIQLENEKLKQEAEDRRLAEKKAQMDRDLAENDRIEKETAEQAKRDKEKAELQAFWDKKAQKEREEAHARLLAETQERERLEQEKRERLEQERKVQAEKDADDAKEAERIADQNHRDSIHSDIECALGNFVDEKIAIRLVAAIAEKRIPHLTINY